MIVTIDPGVHACAVAWLENGTLLGAKFIAPKDYKPAAIQASSYSHVVVERPEYQGLRTQSSRPADLMALSWAGALLAGRIAGATGAHLIELAPSQWKGSEPKPAHHARMWGILTREERAILGGDATHDAIARAVDKGARERWKKGGSAYYPRKWTTHNLLDAVGIACYYVGRLPKHG